MKLQGRTILITGGSSGIGLELARQLLARGNTVLITGRDAAKLAQAKADLPGLHTWTSDVADAAGIAELYRDVTARFPSLDVLVNNAGIMRNISLTQPRGLDDLTRELDINLRGPLQMVQQFLPHLQRQPEALIVNVSSGLAFVPMPIAPIYSATKAALHSYTQSLAMQLRGTTVRAVELAPPGVETPLFRGEFEEEMRGQKGMDPAVLVRRAIAGIEAGHSEIRPGLANVLKIMSRVAPAFMLRQLAKVGGA
jgi:uncharacterized oxidoreductase